VTLELLSKYGWLLALVSQLFLGWVGWSLKKQFVTREDYGKDAKRFVDELETLEKRLDDFHRRMERAEGRLDDMPSQTEIHELSVALEKLSGELGRVVERVEASNVNQSRLERVMDRVETYLLTNNGGIQR